MLGLILERNNELHKSSLTLLAALVCAGTTHADLIVHVVSDGMLAPKTNSSYCNAPPTPDQDVLYLDVRLAPAANPVFSSDGTIVVIADCSGSSTFAKTIYLSDCPGNNFSNIRFAHGGPSIPAHTRFDVTGWSSSVPPTGPYPFTVGAEVGPSPDYTFIAGEGLGQTPLWTRPPQYDGTDDDYRFDIDWVGSGIIIGFEFDDSDGVHYGWIEIQRLPGFDERIIDVCKENYRVIRYAYETEAGVPALITPGPCLADTNNDGSVTPADFSAWVAAFNTNAPECDQNDDGSCTPADFSAWVANYNAGC